MRTFIACDVYHPGISEVLDELKMIGKSVRFVDPEHTHVTLKFLGETDMDMIETIGTAIERSCQENRSLEIKLKGVGVFPNMNFMRVIWIGLVSPELINIQRRLDELLTVYGFNKEKKWKPHLTIGRIKSPADKMLIRDAVERLKDMEIGIADVGSVKLKKSVLRPEGPPIYTDLVEIRL